MKKFIPLVVLVLGALYLVGKFLPARPASSFNFVGFGELPVLLNGRLKPIDTVARSSLLQFQGRQRVGDAAESAPQTESPAEWMTNVFFSSAKADTYPVFRIDSPDLLTLMGITEDDAKVRYTSSAKQFFAVLGFLPSSRSRFSYEKISSKIPELERQAKLARPVEAAVRTPFQHAVIQLYGSLVQYQQLKHTLAPPTSDDFLGELLSFQKLLPTGVAAVRAKSTGQPHDAELAKATIELGQRYLFMSEVTNILAVPPATEVTDDTAWMTTGQSLLGSFQRGTVDPSVLAFAGLSYAWRQNQPEQFNKIIDLYSAQVGKRFGKQMQKTHAEVRFNAAEPFYASMTLYVAAFLLAIFSWLKWPEPLARSAFYLVALAWLATTVGIATRMWLEGRPPVTNLYSSALFIGWGSVGLCLILEAIYKNAIGSVAAGLTGFATLLIAHHLSLSGDTLEMMQAVLDSNFWLATHVVIVSTGYAATFLAGFLAIIYILRGSLTRSLDKATADSLARMVYGIVCFATLFSFVGTVLGGIWADQSWGRFWGWDPKENGALIIVLWNALILHARWGGLIKARGLMALAIFGNIVTSWSWFGTNMLGVGLHSYGFTAAAFTALSIFIASQLILIALALRPLNKWRSFQTA
ncbi:MAG: cytochrome c biogenesis protein CcsA [Undibacterium sp.]|nr:cytochrome c biogenesis protein CcsA [Opitutaceae bacterium]